MMELGEKMEINFISKRILVTGAGQGMGRELTKRLLSSGAEVIAVSRTKSHLETLLTECPGKLQIVELDIASKWDETREVIERYGPYDSVVNCAGIAILEPFLEITEKAFDDVIKINLKALLNVSQAASKEMVKNKIAGTIVNISSQASHAALQDHTVYCASKAAVDMITRVMALELGKYNIRVNCVNPTVVLTRMGKQVWSEEAKARPMLAQIPLGRFAEPGEVVDAIMYLLSDKSTMITGSTLPVDGGFLVH